MKILEKINPLKKKKEDFPHFDEKFGKPSGTAVPGPSADVDHPDPAGGSSSGFTQLPSAAPAPSNEKLDSIQRSVQMMNSTLEQLRRNMDSMSQRLSAIENKSSPTQPAPPQLTQQSPPVNAFNPQPQPALPQPAPQPQPSVGQPPQPTEQQKKPAHEEEEEDSGWHF
ncbi:hypothetical protein CMI46_03285 [Candidatus Pacearchaeota archaeon]|nr:hypothetical protein [Candidatus Pacearchaeota archaeon]